MAVLKWKRIEEYLLNSTVAFINNTRSEYPVKYFVRSILYFLWIIWNTNFIYKRNKLKRVLNMRQKIRQRSLSAVYANAGATDRCHFMRQRRVRVQFGTGIFCLNVNQLDGSPLIRRMAKIRLSLLTSVFISEYISTSIACFFVKGLYSTTAD